MTFYLQPPMEYVNLSSLEMDVNNRMQFLLKVSEIGNNFQSLTKILCSFASKSDCLILSSKRDITSHFLLRLAVAILQDRQIQDFWIRAEATLFEHHIKCGELDAVKKSINELKVAGTQTLEAQVLTKQHRALLKNVLAIATDLLNGLHHCHNLDSCSYSVGVPWEIVHELVSKRNITLQKGIAEIRCDALINSLSCIFKELIHSSINQLRNSTLDVKDKRVLNVIKLVYKLYYKARGVGFSKDRWIISRHDLVQEEAKNFPLCMQKLHLQLAKNRRVRHSKRIRYSLFLKDVGLSLEESILFWKGFYSSPGCSGSGCEHVWSGSTARRYEYSIKHMYGKEGRRVNYNAHSCAALQAIKPQPQECSGCPFAHTEEDFLEKELSSFMKHIWPTQKTAIFSAARAGNPSLACGLYLSAKVHKHTPKQRNSFKRCFSESKSSNSSSFIRSRSHLDSSYSNLVDGLSYADICKNRSTHCDSSKMFNNISSVPRESCLTCNFEVVPAIQSFSSPLDFYRMYKYFQ